MAARSDNAVVLGADIEGLAAAVVLAQAGKKVHVVDPCDRAGGFSQRLELHPGHSVPGLLHDTALARRKLLESLGLARHGLAWRTDESQLCITSGLGETLVIGHANLGTAIDVDEQAYRRWRAFLDKLSGLIVGVLDEAPPSPQVAGFGERLRLAKKAFKLRTLGRKDMMELLRISTMPAWDWLEEWFDSPALRAGLVAPVLTGTVVGPRAAGTTAMLLLREAARGPEPVGGLAAVVDALLGRCAETGVQLHLGATPERIHTADAGTTGVELEGGERLETHLVLSALDPSVTLMELVTPGVVPHHIEAEVRTWRSRGSTAVHLFALSKAFSGPDGAARVITATTPVELERAADSLKYGVLPEEPWLDIRVWSQSDPACAPPGATTLSVHVHGVPHELAWDQSTRDQLRTRVLQALERVFPGAGDAIVAEQLLTSVDLEERYGVRGGHLYRGEQALDQLWVQRPSLALSRYSTPIPGLFLCGAASHPGGPFAGGAGILGARMALSDARLRIPVPQPTQDSPLQ